MIMKLKFYIILFMSILVSGCAGTSVPLDEKWRPLEKLQSKRINIGDSDYLTTVGDTVYVADAEKWVQLNPPGSLNFDAVMTHERVHAIEQKKAGLASWLSRYLTDKNFMWRQEQIAEYAELQLRIERGQITNNSTDTITRVWIETRVKSYLKYWNAQGRMATEDQIRTFLIDAIEGRWTP